jgi:hypothetical protein
MLTSGLISDDFVLDVIDPAYQALLETLAAAIVAFDGSGSNSLQFGIRRASTHDLMPVADYGVSSNPTTLNKRMRA